MQWDNTGWTSTIAHASFSSFLVVLQSLVSVDPTTQIVHREKKDEDEEVPSSPLQVSNSYRPRKGHIDATIIKSYCECILHLASASSKTSSTSWFATTQRSPRLLKSKSSFIAKFRLSIQDAVSCTCTISLCYPVSLCSRDINQINPTIFQSNYTLEHRYTSRRSAQDVVNYHDVGIHYTATTCERETFGVSE